jgi:mannose-6-phosphate isomerase-like protein (cupin superfamily)
MEIADQKQYREELLEWCNNIYLNWENVKPRFSKLFDQKSLDEWEESCHKLKDKLQRDIEVNFEDYDTAKSLYDQWEILSEELQNYVRQIGELRKDYGPEPYVVNIEEATKQNSTYRTALWTGEHLQVTLMSINVGEDIGLEVHPSNDQFLRIEQGQGIVQMGEDKDNLEFEEEFFDQYAIMIPAGKWHNITNKGDIPLKIYAIYGPPKHPHGVVHETKADAMAEE